MRKLIHIYNWGEVTKIQSRKLPLLKLIPINHESGTKIQSREQPLNFTYMVK